MYKKVNYSEDAGSGEDNTWEQHMAPIREMP